MSIDTKRHLTMKDSLKTLIDLGVEVKSVIDVGVFEHTRPLIQQFPSLKHILFEPDHHHFDEIKNNYKDLEYELHHLALSDSDGEGYIIGQSNNYTGQLTHSHFSDRPINNTEDDRVISCEIVKKAKLDSIMQGIGAPLPYLLKIDVDGHELEILKGSEQTLLNTSIVVVEAPVNIPERPFMERANFLVERGFYLFDIIGFTYYAKLLHQVDLVFVRGDIVDESEQLRPRETKPIDHSQWYAPEFK